MVNKMYVLVRTDYPFRIPEEEGTASEIFTTLKIKAEGDVSFKTERDPIDRKKVIILAYCDSSGSNKADDSENSNEYVFSFPEEKPLYLTIGEGTASDPFTTLIIKAKAGISFKEIRNTDDKDTVTIVAYCNPSDSKNTKRTIYITSSKEYKKPPLPMGYERIKGPVGKDNKKFVIMNAADGSTFTWVDLRELEKNGTFNGKKLQRFGRRKFMDEHFGKNGYYERVLGPLMQQYKSVEYFHGFYVSCNLGSINQQSGKLQFVEGEKPLTKIEFQEAIMLGAQYEQGNDVQSHLMFGSEYDTMLQWILQSNSESLISSINGTGKLRKTGSASEYCVNEINDIDARVWTQERYGKTDIVVRGGSCEDYGDKCPAAYRHRVNEYASPDDTGIRIAFWLNPKVMFR